MATPLWCCTDLQGRVSAAESSSLFCRSLWLPAPMLPPSNHRRNRAQKTNFTSLNHTLARRRLSKLRTLCLQLLLSRGFHLPAPCICENKHTALVSPWPCSGVQHVQRERDVVVRRVSLSTTLRSSPPHGLHRHTYTQRVCLCV